MMIRGTAYVVEIALFFHQPMELLFESLPTTEEAIAVIEDFENRLNKDYMPWKNALREVGVSEFVGLGEDPHIVLRDDRRLKEGKGNVATYIMPMYRRATPLEEASMG